VADTPLYIKQFAEKRAATGAVAAGLVNALVVYLSLSGLSEVPIFALVAEHWKQSLIGALVPRAVLISLLVTVMTVWATVRSRAAGTVHPPLDPGAPWFGITMKIGLMRSLYGFLVVVGIALVLRVLLPTYTSVPPVWVIGVVALFAGGIAYVMAYTAVLRIAQQVEDQVAKA